MNTLTLQAIVDALAASADKTMAAFALRQFAEGSRVLGTYCIAADAEMQAALCEFENACDRLAPPVID